ncbi:MAG: discoidin domain-containing protein [Candidatus Theseobacter exili]|nr:discoidin domain-containing protein [Candidatus Theseobacter exili]
MSSKNYIKNLFIKRNILWLIFIALSAGFALRLGYLLSIKDVLDPDEAVIGLIGRHILEGQFPIFMYGQAYIGTLEPLLISPFFYFFGANPFTLRLPALILSSIFPFLIGFYAYRLYGKTEGIFAFILGAIGPVYLTGLSIISWGNYVENLVFTSLVLIITNEIVFRTEKGDLKRRRWLFAGLGLIAGIGWWSHPSIVVPLAVCALFIFLDDKMFFLKMHFWIAVVCFVLGSLPLWIYNFQNGYITMDLLFKSGGPFRIKQFFKLFSHLLQNALGVDRFISAKFILRGKLVRYVSSLHFWVLLGLLGVFFATRLKRIIAPLTFNLKKADGSSMLVVHWLLFSYVFCTTRYGADNEAIRYLLPLFATIIPALSVGLSWIWKRTRLLASVILGLIIVLNIIGHFYAFSENKTPYGQQSFGIRSDAEIINFLKMKGITEFYGKHRYWTTVSFITGEKITGSDAHPFRTLLPDPRYNRYPRFANKVDNSENAAWIIKKSNKKRFETVLKGLKAKYKRANFEECFIYTDITSPEMESVPISSNGWKAFSQGIDKDTEAAFDRNLWTVWTSSVSQSDSVDFFFDTGRVSIINKITFFSGNLHPYDYPRGFLIQVSSDGANWKTVAEKQQCESGGFFWNEKRLRLDCSGRIVVIFEPLKAQYIRIKLLGGSRFCWSIAELFVYGPDAIKTDYLSQYLRLMDKADALSDKKRYSEAARNYFRAANLDYEDEEAYMKLSNVLELIKADPVTWLLEQSEYFVDSGDASTAVLFAEKAFSFVPGSRKIAEWLKKLYILKGDKSNAETISNIIVNKWTPENKVYIDYDIVSLLGYDLDKKSVKPGEEIAITYYWQVLKKSKISWVFFIHFTSNGVTVFDDHSFNEGGKPLAFCYPGEIIIDKRNVAIPDNFPVGTCKIGIGLWNPASNKRLPVKETDLIVDNNMIYFCDFQVESTKKSYLKQ